MTVNEMISELRRRGYDMDGALVAISKRPELGITEVVKAKYKRKAGTATRYNDGTHIIRLASRLWLTPGNAWDAIYNTFLHELAHCFAQDVRAHGWEWARWCKIFGIKPDIYHPYEHLKRKKAFVVAVCIDCTHEYTGRRRLNRTWKYTCHLCGGGIEYL